MRTITTDRVLVFILWALLAAIVPDVAHAEDCPSPRVCTSGEAINASADALCRRARSAETRLTDEVLPDLAAVQSQRDVCVGRLAQVKETPAVVPWRAPLWLRLALDVGAVALGSGAGAVAGIGGPSEVVVGLVVGSVGALIARVVLELVH